VLVLFAVSQIGSGCLCGTCQDCSAQFFGAPCGGNCRFETEAGGLPPKSLDFKVCGKGPGDTIVVDFRRCIETFTADSSGIFHVVKPTTGCGRYSMQSLQPWFDVMYEKDGTAYEIHTSCSSPIYLGQTYGKIDQEITLVGYCLLGGTCNTINVADPCD